MSCKGEGVRGQLKGEASGREVTEGPCRMIMNINFLYQCKKDFIIAPAPLVCEYFQLPFSGGRKKNFLPPLHLLPPPSPPI